MSQPRFDTSVIAIHPQPQGGKEPKKRTLSPPRLHSNRISQHQYLVREGDLFTLLVYDKDHDRSPYILRWTVNIPGREVNKGTDVFKLEKVPRDSKHRYNVDIYRQKVPVKADQSYSDEVRRGFKVVETMKALGNILVSRQEIAGEAIDSSIDDQGILQIFLN